VRLYRFSRAVWVVGVITVGLLSSHIFAQGGKWGPPPVPSDLFNDGKTEGKNPQPTHRLASTDCDDCQKIVKELQAALDDWYVMQLAEAKDIQVNYQAEDAAAQQQAKNKLKDDAMAGLGQPNAKDLDAKQKQQKKDAKDKKATHGSKDALAKEIKRLADALQDCLKKCAPTPTPTATPTTEEEVTPTPPPTPEKEVPPPPVFDIKVPKLPPCFDTERDREKYRKELTEVFEKLKQARKNYDQTMAEPPNQAWADFKATLQKALADVADQNTPGDDGKDKIDKVPKPCPKTATGGGTGKTPTPTPKGKPKKAPRVTTGGNVSYGGGPTEDFCTQISENKIKIDTVGTGETIGHVADLVIENLTDQPIECAIPPMVLESRSGKSQHYESRGGKTVEVAPHQKKTVPLDGVCLARNKPPVSKGVGGDLAFNDCDPDARIGHDDAHRMVDIVESKYVAADKLEEEGKLKDMPYRDPKKRKDIVVQWSTWADPRISDVTGAPPATKDDLKKVVYKQAEEQGPMTPDKKKKIDEGIDTIFDKIELTTQKAKDLEKPPPEEETTPAMPSGPGENVSNDTPTPAPQTEEKKKKIGKNKKKKKYPKPIQDWVDKKNAADDAQDKLHWEQNSYHWALIGYCDKNSKHWRELLDACTEARKKAKADGATQADKDNADKVCNELKKQEDELAKDFNKTEEGQKASDKVNEAQKAADKASAEEKEAGKNIDQATKDAVNEEEKKVKAVW
jgi:hypothetical protein